MLKINNTNFKKYKIPLFLFCSGISGIFLFQYLTFIPEYSSAEEISTPVYDETKVDTRTLSDITYMQEMTSSICERSAVGEEKLNVIDSRDESAYSIKKLSDERCWMTQNLRIVDKEITSADSDVTSNYTVPVSSKSWSDTAVDTNKVHYAGNETYGAYYSWYSATAGTGVRVSADGQNALGSICPKGWRLPTSGSSGEFQDLIDKGKSSWTTNDGVNGYWLGDTTNNTGSAFFPAGGYIFFDSVGSASNYGYYWSSTAGESAKAYYLVFDSSTILSSGVDKSYFGYSVRCVARDNVPDVKIPEIDNPNVSVTIDKILTIELSNKEVNIEPKTNEIMTGNFTTKVSSNAGYDIGLSAADGSSTALVNKKDNVVVAEIPASNNIQVGNNGWGIKCTEDENCVVKNYNALTLFNNPQVYFSSTNAATNKPTNFEVGIGISPSLPSGTYSTNILVTASQK